VETFAAGRYRVERALGEGAMARVLLARDTELDRRVALKLLDSRLAEDESFRARFAREARVAASLSHPNVVTVFDVGEAGGVPFIVMEYVHGRTLEDRLGSESPLPADEVRAIAAQVCAGLDHAHTHGLVHRDLKPGNLIERDDGVVKIADFGIARALEATELTDAGTIIGTAAYLAPEQAEGGTVTPATDLFGLGVVLYELVTGSQPWKIDSLASLAGRRTAAAPELPASVPADLREAIGRCLQPEPEDRPVSAAAVASLLDGTPRPSDRGGEPTVVIPRTARARDARRPAQAPRRRSPAVWLLALLGALVLGLAALGLALSGSGNDGGGPAAETTTPARVEPVPDGATPGEDARNLAEWLRERSG
jgi:eukaryotic-like serine/threonine-protein kinase